MNSKVYYKSHMTNSPKMTEGPPADDELLPFETDLQQKLQRPTYAAYYLLDVFECHDEEPSGIVRALKDIIQANQNDWLLPSVCIHYATLFLQPTELETVIDYLSLTLTPECTAHLVEHDMFQFYRDIIAELKGVDQAQVFDEVAQILGTAAV